MWTHNKLFSLTAWPISFPFFFILLRGRLTDDFVLIKFECASKEKSYQESESFQEYLFPMMSPRILFVVIVYFLELGSESLNVDFSNLT